MNCFPCFSSQKSKNSTTDQDLPVALARGPDGASPQPPTTSQPSVNEKGEANKIENKNSTMQTFTFRELAAATKNFRQECLLGESGFGRVYKGTLQPSGQVVAVKQLDRNGMQGNKDFHGEVSRLGLLKHQNLVNLIGYCADGEQRLLVYEFMPFGSVEDHLFDIAEDKKPLDWLARMKIASGGAQGLEYLHEKANPPIIYRDLKSSNILLDEEFNPRLSDFGLAKLGLGGSKKHISPRVMGTYGYCAPEYERKGELTLKSDVYSFGVVLLELITGRRAIDTTRSMEEQNLVTWAQPFFREPKRFPEMADPIFNNKFSVRSLNQVVGVAAMCLQEEPSVRPLIGDVVAVLSSLITAQDEVTPSLPVPNQQPSEVKSSNEAENHHHDGSSDDEQEENYDSDHTNPEIEGGESCSEGSNYDDGDNLDRHEENNNSEKRQGQVKKTVKWATNSRPKSKKVESEDGSNIGSRTQNDNTIESYHQSYGQNPKSNRNEMQGSNSSKKSKVQYRNENVDSSSSDNSDVESQNGNLGKHSRTNSDVGGPNNGGFGCNSRQDSGNVRGSHDRSKSCNLKSTNNTEWQDESVSSRDGSVHSNS